jgi:histone-arginine methyltransferase CARM1
MMQDFIRTSTYQRAIISNVSDFKDKVVLDVGAGSGILSFFAVQAGARKVYAVEASSMAKHAEQLVFSNKLTGKISVIPGKIEEITVPEQVDIIISEPMGYMLFNERMLETYLHAKKWLRPGGRMFPTLGDLHVAPFSDASLYMEQLNKANFWYQEHFHGVDLSSLRNAAVSEYFRQPVVDTFDVRICTAKSHKFSVNFETADEKDLHRMHIPFNFTMLQSAEVHGLAFWFDVAFLGTNQPVWLSTAPTQPLTHWYQVRCLVDTPVFLHRGQQLTGHVILNSNKRQSYDVEVELVSPSGVRVKNTLDLKNPYFRYTGQAPAAPPGTYEASPSEQYWQTLDSMQVAAGSLPNISNVNIVNGGMNGAHNNLIDVTQLVPQQIVQNHQNGNSSHTGLVPLAGTASPGNPNRSSPLPRAGTSAVPTVPCSIGGGISPLLFNAGPSVFHSAGFPVSNSLMTTHDGIAAGGDYSAFPGQIPAQAQQHSGFK